MTHHQHSNHLLMIRPQAFSPNTETAADNAFQETANGLETKTLALAEFDQAVKVLRSAGLTVTVFEDTDSPDKPDAVFLNNWFSTHASGELVLYPMYAPIRRQERRQDIAKYLTDHFEVNTTIDLSPYEHQKQFLEGTGALVIDHQNSIAYVSRSHRTNDDLINRLCKKLHLKAQIFDTADSNGIPIYHTNVMMCVGTDIVIIALELISDVKQRNALKKEFIKNGKNLIELSEKQVTHFAGNMIEVCNHNKQKVLVMSQTAKNTLTAQQIDILQDRVKLLTIDIPTIEMGGGSARCMIALNHFQPKSF